MPLVVKGGEETPEARRERNARPHNREARRAYMASERGLAVNRKAQEKHRDRHPEKVKARAAAQTEHGSPDGHKCEVCGAPAEQKHHTDYSSGTKIRWLCHKHHMKAHHPTSTLKSERLPGGRADGMSAEDFPAEAVHEGTRHELEHTFDEDLAREIALDHLAEDPRYYERLKEMEMTKSKDHPFALIMSGALSKAFPKKDAEADRRAEAEVDDEDGDDEDDVAKAKFEAKAKDEPEAKPESKFEALKKSILSGVVYGEHLTGDSMGASATIRASAGSTPEPKSEAAGMPSVPERTVEVQFNEDESADGMPEGVGTLEAAVGGGKAVRPSGAYTEARDGAMAKAQEESYLRAKYGAAVSLNRMDESFDKLVDQYMQKGEDIWHGEGDRAWSPHLQLRKCGECNAQVSAVISKCTECGHDHLAPMVKSMNGARAFRPVTSRSVDPLAD